MCSPKQDSNLPFRTQVCTCSSRMGSGTDSFSRGLSCPTVLQCSYPLHSSARLPLSCSALFPVYCHTRVLMEPTVDETLSWSLHTNWCVNCKLHGSAHGPVLRCTVSHACKRRIGIKPSPTSPTSASRKGRHLSSNRLLHSHTVLPWEWHVPAGQPVSPIHVFSFGDSRNKGDSNSQ